MRYLNYGHTARLKIAKWIDKGLLVIDQDTNHWDWKGTTQNGVPVIKYGGKICSLKKFLFKSFYNRFDIQGQIRNHCGHEGCVNPLHHYTLRFVDLNTNVQYVATAAQAIVNFSSFEDPVTSYGIYDIKDAPEGAEELDQGNNGIRKINACDLPMLRVVSPEYTTIRVLPAFKPHEPK